MFGPERLTARPLKSKTERTSARQIQELGESRGGRPAGLPVLMNLMVSVDVKQH